MISFLSSISLQHLIAASFAIIR